MGHSLLLPRLQAESKSKVELLGHKTVPMWDASIRKQRIRFLHYCVIPIFVYLKCYSDGQHIVELHTFWCHHDILSISLASILAFLLLFFFVFCHTLIDYIILCLPFAFSSVLFYINFLLTLQ